MEHSEGEMEEDEAEWKESFEDKTAAVSSGLSITKTAGPAPRVILHFDLDCFYAQVEMIRNPELRLVPLGIQQKYIIVTCNYVARERGVTKLMSVTDAKEKCPELVLVNGEDLTHYREMSYKFTELLMSHSPLVERLGFDENFMDITEMVERRLSKSAECDSVSFRGHVYNHPNGDVEARNHPGLAVGSHIAAELREAVHSKLGLTGCAGIANNKLLAKLVSGTFKPNQQTVLLPENTSHIMDSLSSLRKVPGVGHQTTKRLQTLGLVSVKDLQLCPLSELVREFGGPAAQRLKNLSLGIDESPVSPTGAPQSLSDEDSFKKMSSTKEVVEKIQQLLSSLVERMQKDGRQPQTFRLTVRKYSATNKWFNRESRQCPIPNNIGHRITSGSVDDAVAQLLPLARKLFQKMVDCRAAFHLTLINVCFSNLQSRAADVNRKGAITSFFTQNASPRKTVGLSSQSQVVQDESSPGGDSLCTDHQVNPHCSNTPVKKQAISPGPSLPEESLQGFKWEQSIAVGERDTQRASSSTMECIPHERNDPVTHLLPSNVDPTVFNSLPEEIQKELLSPAYLKSFTNNYTNSSSVCDDPLRSKMDSPQLLPNSVEHVKEPLNELASSERRTAVNHRSPAAAGAFLGDDVRVGGTVSSSRSSDCHFPGNVDPEVFSQLPADVQRELMTEWKQKKPLLKTPTASRRPGRNSKDRKAAGKGSNSLFKYFKPG